MRGYAILTIMEQMEFERGIQIQLLSTKERIKTELLKLLDRYSADDLTLKLFCAESGISKQTLYNHYYSLMDAIEDAYRNEFEARLAECNDYQNWAEGFLNVLKTLNDRKNTCLHLYHSSRRDVFIDIIAKYGEALVKRGIEECSRDFEIRVSEKDRLFMLRFYMHVFIGVLRDYMEDKMRDEPEYIASRCEAMLRHHIRNSLKNIRDLDDGCIPSQDH